LSWRSIINLVTHGATDPEAEAAVEERPEYDRLAIPFKFQPRLSVYDATLLALRGLLRICLGSILFGAWGAYALMAWTSIPNLYLRTAAMVPMFALFLAMLAGMMIATSRLQPRRAPR
jgi:hypothetical protein